MGGEAFYTVGRGKSLDQAFRSAVKEATRSHGNRGYTGTIAEKEKVVLIVTPTAGRYPTESEATAFAESLIESGDSRIDDKWGPAGAIQFGDNDWLFFGWAAS